MHQVMKTVYALYIVGELMKYLTKSGKDQRSLPRVCSLNIVLKDKYLLARGHEKGM